jgi:hypothetical protein
VPHVSPSPSRAGPGPWPQCHGDSDRPARPVTVTRTGPWQSRSPGTGRDRDRHGPSHWRRHAGPGPEPGPGLLGPSRVRSTVTVTSADYPSPECPPGTAAVRRRRPRVVRLRVGVRLGVRPPGLTTGRVRAKFRRAAPAKPEPPTQTPGPWPVTRPRVESESAPPAALGRRDSESRTRTTSGTLRYYDIIVLL